MQTTRGEVPGYLWTPEDGWTDPADIERQVSAIITIVLEANVDVDYDTRMTIVRTLTRLKHCPPEVLTELIREYERERVKSNCLKKAP